MSELLTYGVLGFHHIADLTAADHILFLLALGAVYRLSLWRPALWVISAFTLGHSLTLGLAVTGTLVLPTQLIELLIPVTILLTCLENFRSLGQPADRKRIPYRAGLALVFGLVHGAGFANYLRTMFVDRVTLPLLGFNVGIEVGQVLILLLAGVACAIADWAIGLIPVRRLQPFPARVSLVSAMVAVLAGRMIVERSIW